MALDLQYTLINDTPADASPPQQNFDRIENYINTELIDRAGTTAMTGQLKLLGDPVAALDAAPKQYVDAFLPIGSMLMYGGTAVPIGGKWALCNGADLEAALYPDLFAVIGVRYGGASGRFNLPNLAGRFPMGTSGTDVMGTSGGTRDNTVAPHTHPVDHAHAAFTTGTDSPDHAHLGVNHLHAFGGTTAGMDRAATHNHVFTGVASGGTGPGITTMLVSPFGTTQSSTLDTNTDHLHSFSGTTGAADRDLTTGGANARHAHSASVPAYAGASGAASGAVAATNANLPPYVVVNFIIRAL